MGITGFFPGNWDLVHAGHILALKEAKRYCDYLVVGIKKDASVDQNKQKPILSPLERRIILESVRFVDGIIDYETERELFQIDDSNFFQVRFMGNDHKASTHHPIGTKIVYISRKHNYSSTNLRERIYKAECKKYS